MKDCGHNAKRDRDSNYCHSCYMQGWRKKNRKKINKYQRQRHRERIETEDGYREKVKARNRSLALKRKYGISVDEYNELLRKANNKCEICGSDGSNGHHGKLCVDHCHDTGRIRGILCDPCNKKLGNAGDSVDSIMTLLKYLQKHEGSK